MVLVVVLVGMEEVGMEEEEEEEDMEVVVMGVVSSSWPDLLFFP